jgi:hypothetical protein
VADPDRPTLPQVELIATVDKQPTPGSRVMALQWGASLVPAIWTTTSYKDFDAWMHYPKIPDKVKKIQADRLCN